MSGSDRLSTDHTIREQPLAYLPSKGLIEYRRGQVIFDQGQPADGLHLVAQGRVKVTSAVESGALTLVDIYAAGEFFGESGLLGPAARGQSASALETTALRSWTSAEIEAQVEQHPKLGMALVQIMAQRCLDFEERLKSFALEKTPARMARTLLRFANRLGARQPDGTVRIPPLTHQLMAEYVGTSREIITTQMNDLREAGLLRYSRQGIDVEMDAMREFLAAEGKLARAAVS
jgi:CRP/FNR family transcriptional regulator